MNLNIIMQMPFLIADIPYLRFLHLDRNPLQKVESNAFEMIPQLVSLDLSRCKINWWLMQPPFQFCSLKSQQRPVLEFFLCIGLHFLQGTLIQVERTEIKN